MINKDVVPQRVEPHALTKPAILHTGGGTTRVTEGVTLKQIRFPELSSTRSYTIEVEALLSPHTANYDVTLGQDVKVAARLTLCGATQTIRCGDLSVSWKSPEFLKTEGFLQQLSDGVTRTDSFEDSFTTQLTTKEIFRLSTNKQTQEMSRMPKSI